MFQKEMIEAIKESNLTFMTALEMFDTSMSAVAQSLSKSVENMARACMINDHPSAPTCSFSFLCDTMMHERYTQNLNRNYINNGSGNHSTNPTSNSDDFGAIFRTAVNN